MAKRQTEVGMWWFRPSPGQTNFGDELGADIVRRLGYSVTRVPLGQADLISAGSIIGLASAQAKTGVTIWGSGLLVPTDSLAPGRAKIKAVRGSLTARRLGVEVPLGDPGILVPRLWDFPRSPRHRVGVIPHYVDKNRYPWADRIINPLDPVDEVIRGILSCHTIASSSLHGLIVAQSYGIPAMRLHHPKVIGDEFKWVDYMSAIDGRTLSEAQSELVRALDS